MVPFLVYWGAVKGAGAHFNCPPWSLLIKGEMGNVTYYISACWAAVKAPKHMDREEGNARRVVCFKSQVPKLWAI